MKIVCDQPRKEAFNDVLNNEYAVSIPEGGKYIHIVEYASVKTLIRRF